MLTSLCFGPKLFALWGAPAALPNDAWRVLASVLLVATMFSQPLMLWALLRELRNRHAKALRDLDAWEVEHIERDVTEDRMLLASV
jgi:hypothetical protein